MAEPFRFILQVIVPAFAILAAAGLAALAVATSSWPPTLQDAVVGALLLAPASILAAAGVFALVGRRRHPAGAEATSYFLAAAFAVFMIWAAASSFRSAGSPKVVRGELLSVVHDHTRRGPDNLDLRISGYPDSFTWYCGTRDCQNGVAILALQDVRPVQVELHVVDSRIVGMWAHGRPMLDVSREVERSRSFSMQFGLVATLLAGLCVYFGIRRLRRSLPDSTR